MPEFKISLGLLSESLVHNVACAYVGRLRMILYLVNKMKAMISFKVLKITIKICPGARYTVINYSGSLWIWRQDVAVSVSRTKYVIS